MDPMGWVENWKFGTPRSFTPPKNESDDNKKNPHGLNKKCIFIIFIHGFLDIFIYDFP